MTLVKNNFVEIAGQFVAPYQSEVHAYYHKELEQDSTWLNDPNKADIFTNVYENMLVFSPTRQPQTDAAFVVKTTERPNYPEADIYNDVGLRAIYIFVGQLTEQMDISACSFPQLIEFQQKLKNLKDKKTQFKQEFPIFSLGLKKSYLSDTELSSFVHFAQNLTHIELKIKELNKEIKETHKFLQTAVLPYLFEKYSNFEKKPDRNYRDNQPRMNETVHYHQRQSLQDFFTPLKFTGKTLELIKEIRSLEAEGKKLEDHILNSHEKNAQKKICGYIVYSNKGTGSSNQEDGFVTLKGVLSQNILQAHVLDTERQAYSFAKHKGFYNCMITEINFSFSRIMTAYDCEAGPAMAQLKARTESREIQEMLAPVPPVDPEVPVVKKKNKI